MAWTTPRTWSDGEVPTASIMNTHWRDNLNHVYGSAVSTFSPTVTQSGSVALTTATGRYVHVGDTCFLHVFCDSNGTGTAGNAIVIGNVPAAVAPRVSGAFASAQDAETGQGWYFDSGAVQPLYRCLTRWNSSSDLVFFDVNATANSIFGVAPAVTVAAADSLALTVVYSTATPSA